MIEEKQAFTELLKKLKQYFMIVDGSIERGGVYFDTGCI